MLRLLGDFQSVRDEDRLVVSLHHGLQGYGVIEPHPSDNVLVEDAEGHSCWASIEQVDGTLLHLRLDWATWRSEDDLDMATTFSGREHREHWVTQASSATNAAERRLILNPNPVD